MVTVGGIFKDGKVELCEPPPEISEARVLVTFLVPEDVDLQALGITEVQAADLRAKFETFEDWNDPAMDIYSDYDAAKAALDSKV
ncbi:MAG TPA: hypothetical protein VK747_13275 [Blastocatellia bacterium]|nr:hypothetical protein [Blastocatellia bacterium]